MEQGCVRASRDGCCSLVLVVPAMSASSAAQPAPARRRKPAATGPRPTRRGGQKIQVGVAAQSAAPTAPTQAAAIELGRATTPQPTRAPHRPPIPTSRRRLASLRPADPPRWLATCALATSAPRGPRPRRQTGPARDRRRPGGAVRAAAEVVARNARRRLIARQGRRGPWRFADAGPGDRRHLFFTAPTACWPSAWAADRPDRSQGRPPPGGAGLDQLAGQTVTALGDYVDATQRRRVSSRGGREPLSRSWRRLKGQVFNVARDKPHRCRRVRDGSWLWSKTVFT
jgi:hypothetical protein